MNTNPKAKRILCYGDSNVWGHVVHPGRERFPSDVRWTGVLQNLLGDGYEVIEEGMCGRTTDIDDPKDPDRNGKKYLVPCIKTHNPLDLVILLIGLNDLKPKFNKSTEAVGRSVSSLVDVIRAEAYSNSGKTKLLLLSPARLNSAAGDEQMIKKSIELAVVFSDVAETKSCDSLDLAEIAEANDQDGGHLTAESHRRVGEVVCGKVLDIL